MADEQQIVRLQDLDLLSDSASDEPEAENEEALNIKRLFALTVSEADEFISKVYPDFLEVICSLNKQITVKGKTLFFKDRQAYGYSMHGENCLEVCKEAIAAFPDAVNSMLQAIKSFAGSSAIEETSLRLCNAFNTVTYFRGNAERFLCERLSNVATPVKKTVKPDYSENFSEVLTIPVGKSASREIAVNFNTTCPDAHAVIAGMSGSGKSSLLQSIILSGAYKYSPDKLQFWILDFKDGTGLIQFKALKHVRMMSVKNRASDANEIMDYIKKEYGRRTDLITNSGGGDIRAYNERARSYGKPLLPRLMIIIDEFTIMPRSCFSVLNKIAKVGRSLGMGFILSSQIIEQGAVYSEAVQQANHFFEFKNSDSSFGRLVKNVSEEEKRFVCSGVTGNCIYRRDSERALFRAAYAGSLEAQNAFINKINAKWSEYPYRAPVITGRPERKIKSYTAIACNADKIKEDFKTSKKVFVPLGESRLNEPYLYKIDRENPLLVAFGNEVRVASAEFSVIERFKALSGEEKAVYYVDLNCNPDREENAVTAKYANGAEGVCYANTDDGAKNVIDKVYKILTERKRLGSVDKTKDIGNPIELIIHNAERLTELKGQRRIPRVGTLTHNYSYQAGSSSDLGGGFNSGAPRANANQFEETDVDAVKKLSEIIEYGKNSRIFVMLYFEEKNRLHSVVNELFPYNADFNDVLILPRIPDEFESFSYSEVIDCLSACRLREQAGMFDQSEMSKSDFICAVLIDDKVLHKIIPYEWSVEV